MKRILISTLAAVALFAAPAIAQDGNFTFLSGSNPDLNHLGTFNTDYPGGDALNTGSAFRIFCVDPNNHIASGDTYDAWVTAIAAPNVGIIANETRLGQTLGGAAAYDRYWRAAWLVDAFIGTGSSSTSALAQDYQRAIWEVTSGYLTGATVASQALAATANGVALNSSFFNNWGVITDVATQNGLGGHQEFIAFTVSRDGNLEIVPEPATMSLLAMGLAGMAGAGMRRRKK